MQTPKKETKRFTIRKLEERIAPKITTLQVNGGGNTPGGNANGVPKVSSNPAGNQPPGHN
ncbi:MAG: hypothetical protein ACR2L2_06475 [Acidobacteriota bacterium]